MLPAIRLDDQLGIEANEVGNEAANRVLASETKSCQPMLPQDEPKSAFRIRRSGSHLASEAEKPAIIVSAMPHPNCEHCSIARPVKRSLHPHPSPPPEYRGRELS